MFSRFRQPEIWCDAPPYAVVRACKGCGFQSLFDVRWCRISRLRNESEQRRGTLILQVWHWLLRSTRAPERTCTCGQPSPVLKRYSLSFVSEKVGDYLLGQCWRCRTMFWEAAVPVPAWMEEGVIG
jgi:hypothetical protein